MKTEDLSRERKIKDLQESTGVVAEILERFEDESLNAYHRRLSNTASYLMVGGVSLQTLTGLTLYAYPTPVQAGIFIALSFCATELLDRNIRAKNANKKLAMEIQKEFLKNGQGEIPPGSRFFPERTS